MKNQNHFKNIDRMCRACISYVENKMTIKQVWYRVRGYKNCNLIQKYPDKILGGRLLWLYLDFETWYPGEIHIVEESIMAVVDYVLKQQVKKTIH